MSLTTMALMNIDGYKPKYTWNGQVCAPCSCYRQKLAALLCTCSSLWVSADECGTQTVDAYSNVGLAIVVYAAALTGLVQSLRFLLLKPIVLLALETALWMCLDHCKSSLMVTPKYLALSTTSMVWPCRVYCVGMTCRWFVAILMTVHLYGWKLICHSSSHFSIAERFCCSRSESIWLLTWR